MIQPELESRSLARSFFFREDNGYGSAGVNYFPLSLS